MLLTVYLDEESTSIIEAYTKKCVELVISQNNKAVTITTPAGYALLLRGVTAFIMELLKTESLSTNLVKSFNTKKDTVESIADVMLYLLRLRHADIVGEITSTKDIIKLSSFNGLTNGLLYLLVQEVKPNDRAFPKVSSLLNPSRDYRLLQLNLPNSNTKGESIIVRVTD